tara:strand:- start:2818 stop:3519 length:702 start_codon:yes stop_codon:yes gene_type:complete
VTERLLRYSKEEQKNNKDEPKVDGVFPGYWTKQYVKRTGLNPDGSKAPAGAKRKQRRQCTWCKGQFGYGAEEGYDHNRRTCQYRKDWHTNSKTEAAEYRRGFKERMIKSGFGVGTLIKANQYDYFLNAEGVKEWGQQERVLIVTSINWSLVHQGTNRQQIMGCKDVGMPSRRCGLLKIPRVVEWTAEREAAATDRSGMRYTKEGYETLSMSGSLATIPEGWEDGECLEIEEPY